MEATPRPGLVTWRVAAVVAVALAYSWIAAGLRPFTLPEEVAVAVPLVLAGIAVLRVRGDDRETAPRGGSIWGALFAVLVA